MKVGKYILCVVSLIVLLPASNRPVQGQQIQTPAMAKLAELKSLRLLDNYPQQKSVMFADGMVKQLGTPSLANGQPGPSQNVGCMTFIDICVTTTITKDFKVEPANVERFVSDVISKLRPENSAQDFLQLPVELGDLPKVIESQLGSDRSLFAFQAKRSELANKAGETCVNVVRDDADASGCFEGNSKLYLLDAFGACGAEGNAFHGGPWCFIDEKFGVFISLTTPVAYADSAGKVTIELTMRAPLIQLEINAKKDKMRLRQQQNSYSPPNL